MQQTGKANEDLYPTFVDLLVCNSRSVNPPVACTGFRN